MEVYGVMFKEEKKFLELTLKNWSMKELLGTLFTRKDNKLSHIINKENIFEEGLKEDETN